MGNFFSAIGKIADFFLAIGDIAKTMVRVFFTVGRLLTQPHKALMYIIAWMLTLPVYLAAYLFVTFWSIEGLRNVPWVQYYFWTVIVIDLIMTIVWFLIFLLMLCVCLVFWIADLLTFGTVKYLTRTENHIDAWFTQSNFAYENIANRLLIAQVPCSGRFKPSEAGWWCQRQDDVEPSFCPEAQIFRIYKQKKISKPALADRFSASAAFYASSTTERERAVRAFFRTRQKFLSKCTKAMHPFVPTIKLICMNAKDTKLKDESQRDLLKSLCRQVFCDDYSASKDSQPFCATQLDKPSGEADGIGGGGVDKGYAHVAKRMLFIVIMLLLTTALVVMFKTAPVAPPPSPADA